MPRYRPDLDGILNALRNWHEQHGEWPTRAEWDAARLSPASRTICRYGGGNWTSALRLAGDRRPRRRNGHLKPPAYYTPGPAT